MTPKYQIIYYIDYEGWCSYSDVTFDTLEEAEKKAEELSKEVNLEYAVIQFLVASIEAKNQIWLYDES